MTQENRATERAAAADTRTIRSGAGGGVPPVPRAASGPAVAWHLSGLTRIANKSSKRVGTKVLP